MIRPAWFAPAFAWVILCAASISLAADPTPPPHSKYWREPGLVHITVVPVPPGIVREVDVPVAMRDGIKLYVNVYRPEGEGRYPVVLSATRYGKDRFGPGAYQAWAKASGYDIGRMTISEYTPFEAPDPAFWVPHGYGVVHADVRGAFRSEGNIGPNTETDTLDYYDLIEWAARQSWSDGNVGLNGVSYLAFNQWPIAALKPPHLKAIIPWEGVTDHYRDNAFHGGIPETRFRVNAYTIGLENTRNKNYGIAEDYPEMLKLHSLFDDYWQRKAARLDQITVPALVCATWSAQGNHSRGSFEGFKHITSQDKWLYNHGRVEWPTYYDAESTALQLKFFDHFLKAKDNGMRDVPRVRVEIRKTRDEYDVRYADAWPLPDTKHVPLYLDASAGKLRTKPVKRASTVSYKSDTGGKAMFDYTFPRDTRLVGNMKLKLWVSADETDNMDLFVGIRKLDKEGEEVHFVGFGGNPNDVVSRGWLRVSAREKDEQRSTPWQPYLKHHNVLKIKPEEVVPVEVEILPSGTLFERGSTLRLVIQGTDLIDDRVLRHDNSVNRGTHTIRTGGEYDAHVLMPAIDDRRDQ